MKQLCVADAPVQPWKNGGGRTRELLAWPTPQDWWLRISVAEIERDGPFSAFVGVDRWFGVLAGDGVALEWPGHRERVDPAGDLLHFDGGEPPDARLLGGATTDLNVMRRRGGGRIALAPIAQPAPAGFEMLAVFTRDALRLEGGAAGAVELPAMCLAWSAWQRWHVAGATGASPRGWWIAFSPAISAEEGQ
jgi:hypothetical protein